MLQLAECDLALSINAILILSDAVNLLLKCVHNNKAFSVCIKEITNFNYKLNCSNKSCSLILLDILIAT